MIINYNIQAEVVDIKSDRPKASDNFFVDTNIWYWLTYTRSSLSSRPPANYQSTVYPAFTKAALEVGANIFHSGLSLAELAHRIEKTEHEIFRKTNNAKLGTKGFRHNYPHERSQVVSEIQIAYEIVMSFAKNLIVTIDPQTTAAALARFKKEEVDGYDLFLLETMKNNNVSQIITDDGDFSTVPDVQVFTANRNVLKAAARQHKLISR